MVFVFSQLFHISGNSKGSQRCDDHIILRKVKQNAVILCDDLYFPGMQKNRELAENLLILVLLPNENIELFDHQFDFSNGTVVHTFSPKQRFNFFFAVR